MSTERIKELLELMEDHNLAELEMEEGEFKVRLAKHQAVLAGAPAAIPVQAAVPAGDAAAAAAPVKDTSNLIPVNSPIVGTFYQAPAPDADPFVKVGDSVSKDTVVCIIEAMKVMNEIKAETGGTIAEVLVENGEAVEYGQPLFLVKP